MSKNSTEIHDKIAIIRGAMIQNCTFLERVMDEAISQYFSSDVNVRQDLLTYILCTDRITWKNKLEVFRVIVEKNCLKEDGNKYKEFKAKCPSYFNEIDRTIISNRNIFAHLTFDSRDGFIERFNKEKKIRFLKFKAVNKTSNMEHEEFDNDELVKIRNCIKKHTDAIMELNV